MPRGRSRKAVALYVNPGKPAVRRVLPRIVKFLKSYGIEPLGLDSQADDLPRTLPLYSAAELGRRARFALVLGGDGTFLAAARTFCRARLPLLGLRLGTTGFLTPIEIRDFRKPLGQVLDGDFILEQRAMVEARVLDENGRVVKRGVGLNDVTVKQADMVRLVRLHVVLDGAPLGDFSADGLVVSTATGSTAYSLSAGGPVVLPEARILLATLLCPHTLSSRPIAFPLDSTLVVRLRDGSEGTRVFLDGQEELRVLPSQRLSISGSRHVTLVVRPPGFSFPGLLRSKLDWKR